MTETEHCKDCCCARAWKALGITDYTGKSIPEHIEALAAELTQVRYGLKRAAEAAAPREARIAAARALLEPLAEHDPKIRAWLAGAAHG